MLKMKELRKISMIFTTIFMLCIPYFLPLMQSLANEKVDVNVMPCPPIDIVLAKSKTKVDVTNFEEDLKKELINQNISSDRVKIHAVEAVEANIQDSFNWELDVASAIGSIDITNNGQNIVMKGNKKNPGKNAMWIIPEKEQEQEITFDYSVDFGDSFNAAGMLLRVKQTGNTLTGYMLSLNKSNKGWYKTAGNKYGAIWKFTYQIGTNTTNMTKTFVQGVDIATSGRLNIKSTDTEIIISGGGLKTPIKYAIDTEYGYGFGFFSDHYSHNCSKIGAFTLGNIKLTTTTVKKFKEVLNNPEWREDSLRFLVNVDDTENEELKDKAQLASLQTRVINEKINCVFWGTDKNKDQANEVIAPNKNGTFIDNTDYEKAIKETAQYIKSLVEASKSSQYALVNEKVELQVTPESAKTGTTSEDYPNGKWKINHDYEYFENNLGQFRNSGKYMSDLELSFDKTGRYELLYEDGNIASKYIYVHRKPVADFTIARADNAITLTSTSYDLDSYSKNNGIAEEEWKYKKVGDTNWTAGKLSGIETDEVYLVQLRVKDFQETWSDATTKYVMSNTSQITSVPVAFFRIKNATMAKYEELQVADSSYDPTGMEITDEVWTVKKDGKVKYTGKTPLTNYQSYETGTYTMSLSVTNQAGNVSEEFSRIFELTDDVTPPEVIATPTNSDWTNKEISVNLAFSDKGGSGFKGYQYAITDRQDKPTAWSELILKENDAITIDTEGEKYLHVIGQDNAGNKSQHNVFGPYKIDLSKPEVDYIVPESKDWTKDAIDINVTFSDKGGSGFAGYQYALTTGRESPEQWSERIKEEKAKFTITGEAEYYLHLKMFDHAGNESLENVYGPYQVDKTSPEVKVSPSFSDWTNQPVMVNVSLSDEGGSQLQKYEYSITNNGVKPDKWDKEVTGDPQPIIIDTEGENYLHIIGYDNAGNDSSNQIFGKYKLDFTLPELIHDELMNSDTKVPSVQFAAKDDRAGVQKFVVNGTQVNGAEYSATKNGDYTFEIWDYAGNYFTEKVTIHNVYAECDKDLEHPNYDSSYDKCPICELIDGIKVTENEKIYDATPSGVSYENVQNVKIVEYYNNGLDKPVKAGQYLYELEVNVDGVEYKTGITGEFTIYKKSIHIVGLKLEDKTDDGKTDVNIDKSNLNVEGIMEQDKAYVEMQIAEKTSYDSLSVGDKSVTLQKEKDYQLKLQENIDSSYQELINCYELPETIELKGKLIAKETTESETSKEEADFPTTENEITDSKNIENTSQDKKIEKKSKDRILGKFLYTGRTIGSGLIAVFGVIVILNIISGKVIIEGKHSKKRKPRILEKAMKKD